MDEHSIERIRNANFSHSVRGYDRAEVDRFLAELADWLRPAAASTPHRSRRSGESSSASGSRPPES